MGSVQEEPPAATATPLHRDAIDGLGIWCWGRACTLVRGGSGSLRCEEMRVPDMRDMHIRTARQARVTLLFTQRLSPLLQAAEPIRGRVPEAWRRLLS